MVLLRFLDPAAGTVTLGGVDIATIDGDVLRTVIGLGTQDAHIFDSTLAENLRLARPAASGAELREALRRARLLGQPDSKTKKGKFTVKIARTDSPVTRGLSDFDLSDELYYNLQMRPGVEPLATIEVATVCQLEPDEARRQLEEVATQIPAGPDAYWVLERAAARHAA